MDFNAPRWQSVDGTLYEFDSRSSGSDWIGVRGGDMSHAVSAKFTYVAGTPRLMGLRFDSGEPLTARQLREPRLTALEAAFALYLDQEERRHAAVREQVDARLAADDLTEDEAEDVHGASNVLHQLRQERDSWLAHLGDTGDATVTPRGRGSSPPTERELRAFAAELTKQQRAGRGAVQRTAAAIGMNRSTVYRWIEACRHSGLLPPKEGTDGGENA